MVVTFPGVTVKLVDQLVLGLVTVPEQALAPVAMRLSSSASLDELGMKEVQKSDPMVLCDERQHHGQHCRKKVIYMLRMSHFIVSYCLT